MAENHSTEIRYCACGCGKVLPPPRRPNVIPRYAMGHDYRTLAITDPHDPRGPNPSGLCMCGCGQQTSISKETRHGRAERIAGCFHKYIKGHDKRKIMPVGNSSGLCKCGCGRQTPIAQQTRLGNIVGQPRQYCLGHQFLSKHKITDSGCWELPVHRSDGYTRIHRDGKLYMGHVYYWIQINGPLPDGYELDHLCRNRSCVNPEHMEPVPHKENIRRIYRDSDIPIYRADIQPEIDPASGCWNYPVCQADGYARIWIGNNLVMAHRFFYEKHRGRIQDGLQLDHLCQNRRCVNPDHLEPVTRQENIKRISLRTLRKSA